jgi:hypothetical protein
VKLVITTGGLCLDHDVVQNRLANAAYDLKVTPIQSPPRKWFAVASTDS